MATFTGSNGADVFVGVEFETNLMFGLGGDDRLTGANRDDILNGGAGADALIGGEGADTADYSTSKAVTVVLASGNGLGNEAQGDSYIGIENVIGGTGNDTLIGDAANNVLSGGAGSDVLRGGAGQDRLRGGAGDDVLAPWADDGLPNAVDGGDGFDIVDYSDRTLGEFRVDLGAAFSGDEDILVDVEGVIGTAFDDTLFGDDGANTLRGGANGGFGDFLEGRGGADLLDGGAGTSDSAGYSQSLGGVSVNLTTGTGRGADAEGDQIVGIEQVFGSLFADTIIGSAVANIFFGGGGDDLLSGRGGADTIDGGEGGLDFASYAGSVAGVTVDLSNLFAEAGGDAQGDILFGIEGVIGSDLADKLTGGAGRNVLRGAAGADILSGGADKDTLNGGTGADTFDLNAIGDSTVGTNRDVIEDFRRAQGDRIDLSTLDANTGAAGNQAFAFVGAAVFSGTAGELRYNGTVLQGDIDGNGAADFQIQLLGVPTLVASDLLL